MAKDWPKGTLALLCGSGTYFPLRQSTSRGPSGLFRTASTAKHLRVLARLDIGETSSPSMRRARFKVSLAELGIEVPSTAKLLVESAAQVAEAIVQGVMPPREGTRQIHDNLVGPFLHPAELQEWCYLDDGIDPVGSGPLGGRELDQAILRTAREWAGRRTRG